MQHHYTKAFNLDKWCSVWLRKASDPNTRLLWCWLCRVSESFWLYIWLRVWMPHGQIDGIWVKVSQVCHPSLWKLLHQSPVGFSIAVVVVVIAYFSWLLVLAAYVQMLDVCLIIALFYYRCAVLMQPSEALSDCIAPPFLCCWGNGKLTADEFIDYVFGTEVSGSNQKLLGDLTQNHVDCFACWCVVPRYNLVLCPFPFWMRCNSMANLGIPLF